MSQTSVLTASSTSKASVAPSLPKPSTSSSRLRLRIDNNWYDVTQWKHLHPGGSEILEHLNGQDATDAFYSLHSTEAIERLGRMSKTPVAETEAQPIAELASFREFRKQLQREGWFDRNVFYDLCYLFSVYILAVAGTWAGVTGYPVLAILLIGLSMEQAGWIGHDYVHGRGTLCYYMGRSLGGGINGFSSKWWSNKHNTHHCYTNYIGIDADIENDPVFHLFFPTPENDVSFRRYQHLYFVPVASFIFVSWRIQSIQYAIKHSHYGELVLIALNYIWLLCLPLYVSIGSILLSGVLVAVIVTASHQSEEMFEGKTLMMNNDNNNNNKCSYNFVRTQFESTRDAITSNFVLEWLWGGMQYQLEHHLFPTMPKYYYASLVSRVREWAEKNGLPYKTESEWDILKRNYNTLRYFAQPIHHHVQ